MSAKIFCVYAVYVDQYDFLIQFIFSIDLARLLKNNLFLRVPILKFDEFCYIAEKRD